jgi:hypothetical protein
LTPGNDSVQAGDDKIYICNNNAAAGAFWHLRVHGILTGDTTLGTNCGNAGSGDLLTCLIADMAALLLHEILHLCGARHTGTGGAYPYSWCHVEDVGGQENDKCLENTFRWALSKIYSLDRNLCCSRFQYAFNTQVYAMYGATTGPCAAGTALSDWDLLAGDDPMNDWHKRVAATEHCCPLQAATIGWPGGRVRELP